MPLSTDALQFAVQFRKHKEVVESYFDNALRSVYGIREFEDILRTERASWKLPTIPVRALTELMQRESHLSEVLLESESYGTQRRFSWRTASPYETALSLRPGSYLSHATAAYLHGLHSDVPATFFANKEQSAKPTGGSLTQAALDRAFQGRQRESRYVFQDAVGRRYTVLSGKFTSRLEVDSIQGPAGETLYATKLERTLIDLAVRPAYAGGIARVIRAYEAAKDRAGVRHLIAVLKRLDYVYPYHQAIGYYMERAGYPGQLLAAVRQLGLNFDFYLDYGIKEPLYDATWRVYVPRGL